MIKLRNNIPSETFTLHDGEYILIFHRDNGRMSYGGWLCSYPDVVEMTDSLVIESGKPHFTADMDAHHRLASDEVIRLLADTWKSRVTLIRLGSRAQYLCSISEFNELIDRGVLRLTVTGTFTKRGFNLKTIRR